MQLDPKLAWALSNRDRFPLDVNRADRMASKTAPRFHARLHERLQSRG